MLLYIVRKIVIILPKFTGVHVFLPLGYSVFAKADFQEGDFLLEYRV